MRALDNWSVYFDNDRNPLLGRLTFFKLHTTEKVVVTTESGVAIDNPIHTTENGKTTQQVFLPDDDVTVLVEKYIGGGNMSDDENNQSAWVEQYTFDSLKNTVIIDIGDDIVSAGTASTMADLRQLDITAINYALLYGYYEMGDMPIAKYVLDLDATSADNAGSIIRVDSQHVWRLVPDRVIDCRIFGVFPSEDDQTINAYNSQLRLCFSYANSLGLDIYMPQVYPNAGYYYIEGATHTLSQKLYIDAGVTIVGKPGTSSTLTVDEIEYFGHTLFRALGTNGSIRVNCPTVKTSWKATGWATWPGAVKKFIVDSLDTPFTMRNAIVEFTNDISGRDITMEQCLITSDNHIRDCVLTLNNCDRVSDFWIYTGVTLHLTGNVIKLDNFSSAQTYVEWKNIQGDTDYGDLGEQTISNVTLGNNSIVENAQFDNVSVHGKLELHNVSGSINVTANDLNLNAADCWLTINGKSNVITGLQIRRGSLIGNNLQVLSNLYLDDVDINTNLTTLGATAEIRNSEIRGNVFATNIALLNNDVYATVNQRDANGVVTVNVVENRFRDNGYHSVSPTTDNSIVNGKWVGNEGLGSNMPILLDRTKINPDETAHTYTYVGNTGSIIGYKEARWDDVVFMGPSYGGGDAQGSTGTKEPVAARTMIGNDSKTVIAYMGYRGRMNRDDESGGGHTNINYYLTQFAMFTVGTQNVGTLFLTGSFPSHLTESMVINGGTPIGFPMSVFSVRQECPLDEQERLWFSSFVGTPKNIAFVDGYTWRVTNAACVFALTPFEANNIDLRIPVVYELRH